jgi:uncharacterized protein involved in exopolysaccharide biosynthesis
VKELAEIPKRLAALPDDAYPERIELQDRHNELRAEAAQLQAVATTEGSTTELTARLANLRQQRDAIEKTQIDEVAQAKGDFGGFLESHKREEVSRLNRQIGESRGLPDLEAQIARMKRELVDRGVDPG